MDAYMNIHIYQSFIFTIIELLRLIKVIHKESVISQASLHGGAAERRCEAPDERVRMRTDPARTGGTVRRRKRCHERREER